MVLKIINYLVQFFRQHNPGGLELKLALSLLAVAVIFIAVKILNMALGKVITGGGRTEDPEEQPDVSFMQSLAALARTLVFYGGIFAAIVTVLGIFQINLITAEDVKKAGLSILKIAGIIVAARITANFIRAVIVHMFSRKLIKDGIENRRAKTMESLLKNITTYLVFFVAGIMILQALNIDTGPILASAGILGLAVGFGAQNLVKDVISGFFIIFEDQFSVGDYVEIGGVTGTVEEIGLRACKIRQWTGQLHIIPNGGIAQIANYSRGYMMAVVTVGIAYEEDIDRTIEVLRQECLAARADLPSILEDPEVQGVTALGDSSVSIRTVARTVPGEQWNVERELMKRFKKALHRANIEIPYPRRVVTYREEYGTGERGNTTCPE
ncbi:MAG: mechanosensitive ion channel family protein [Bacillota bacterium]